MNEQLKQELQLFDEKRAEWVVHYEGKYALLKGDEVAGFYDSEERAFEEGVNRWGNVPFLVKQVLGDDPIEHAPALICGLLDASL